MPPLTASANVVDELVSSLQHHPDNPRQGHVPAIVESIKVNGWFGTLLGQKSTRYILAGNHRLKAAIELGIKTVPVVWVDVDDVKARKIMLADNKVSDLAVYDDEALADLLKLVMGDTGGEELLGTGWTEYDLERLMKDTAPEGWEKYDTDIAENPDDPNPGLEAIICPHCGHTIEL